MQSLNVAMFYSKAINLIDWKNGRRVAFLNPCMPLSQHD